MTHPYTGTPPEVGMGATYSIGSDRYAGTIVRITPKTVTFQKDDAIPVEGFDYYNNQTYTYKPSPTREKTIFRLNKFGRYVLDKHFFLHIGERREYSDPGF